MHTICSFADSLAIEIRFSDNSFLRHTPKHQNCSSFDFENVDQVLCHRKSIGKFPITNRCFLLHHSHNHVLESNANTQSSTEVYKLFSIPLNIFLLFHEIISKSCVHLNFMSFCADAESSSICRSWRKSEKSNTKSSCVNKIRSQRSNIVRRQMQAPAIFRRVNSLP